MDLIGIFYRLYAYFYHRREKRTFGKIKVNTAMSLLTIRIMNLVLPLYFKVTCKNEKHRVNGLLHSEDKIIVSLTSFPARIGKVWLTIESLMRQKMKPDMIILWLSKEQFKDIESLPKRLCDLRERGLIIKFKDDDIKSYKKYHYTIEEYPDATIILADDDFIYDTDLVSSLMQVHKEEPNVICARYGYRMKWDSNGQISSYLSWEMIKRATPASSKVFFGSGGGTLFTRTMMYTDLHNIKLARELCPTADDIYLNAMARLNSTKIRFVPGKYVLASLSIENNETLASTNIGTECQNDIQIKKLNNYYFSKVNKVVF